MSRLLEVADLRKVYGVPGRHREPIVAVDGVSFSLRAGGSLAVVGQSGSGKTTIARMIAGLDVPTSGTVAVAGERRTAARIRRADRRRRARQVQMVFQDPYSSLDPRQTVDAALAEVLAEHAMVPRAARAERIEELLQQVGLDARHARARPRQLSGGQRQRVAIARALAIEPQLVILDEAVAALDVSVQAQIINLLADLRKRIDIAFLFVSHDLAVVRQVCDECIVLDRGRVVEAGTTDDVLDRPRHECTRRLIDAIPAPGWRPTRRLRPTATTR